MQVVLVMFRSDGERRSFSLSHDMTVVGRREDCDLRIPLGDISRKHCRLVKEGDSLRIEDMGSSNGTFVNGRRIQEAILNPGDNLQIGPITFVVQIDGVPADEHIQPPMSDVDTTVPDHDPATVKLGDESAIDLLYEPDDDAPPPARPATPQ
jgi:pSer/pThr/pTyr-binding forkhead associated (FHA) protein